MHSKYILSSKPHKEFVMTQSLYERIGGEAAVNAAVDIFYRKVLADDRISHFFETVDMD